MSEMDQVRGKELMCDTCGCTRWYCLYKFEGACCDECEHPDAEGGVVTGTEWRVQTETTEDDFGADEAAARDWLKRCLDMPSWKSAVLMSREVAVVTTAWAEVKS